MEISFDTSDVDVSEGTPGVENVGHADTFGFGVEASGVTIDVFGIVVVIFDVLGVVRNLLS